MSTIYTPTGAAYAAGITLPSDGDLKSASSVNTGLKGLAENVEYLKQTQLQHIYQRGSETPYTDTDPIIDTTSTNSPFENTSLADLTNVFVVAPKANLAVGDILVCEFTCSFTQTNGGTPFLAQLYANELLNAATPTYCTIWESNRWVSLPADSYGVIHCSGIHVVVDASDDIGILVQGRYGSAKMAGEQFNILQGWGLRVQHYRAVDVQGDY